MRLMDVKLNSNHYLFSSQVFINLLLTLSVGWTVRSLKVAVLISYHVTRRQITVVTRLIA